MESILVVGRWFVALCVICLGCACSPTLNWREVHFGDKARALFPCKPTREVRSVVLAGAPTHMTFLACHAGGATYALGYVDVEHIARVQAVLIALREGQEMNLGGKAEVITFMKVRGMTPNSHAERVRIEGQFPDGTAAAQEGGFFVKETIVYHAAVLGRRLEQEGVEAFFDSLVLAE